MLHMAFVSHCMHGLVYHTIYACLFYRKTSTEAQVVQPRAQVTIGVWCSTCGAARHAPHALRAPDRSERSTG